MSETPHISIYPDSHTQKQRIESQAEKYDMSVSEYCLMAIEKQNARDANAERIDDMDIESRLDELRTAITEDIAAATAISTQQESLYGIALWNLLGSAHAEEERLEALKQAPATLEQELEGLTQKEESDD